MAGGWLSQPWCNTTISRFVLESSLVLVHAQLDNTYTKRPRKLTRVSQNVHLSSCLTCRLSGLPSHTLSCKVCEGTVASSPIVKAKTMEKSRKYAEVSLRPSL